MENAATERFPGNVYQTTPSAASLLQLNTLGGDQSRESLISQASQSTTYVNAANAVQIQQQSTNKRKGSSSTVSSFGFLSTSFTTTGIKPPDLDNQSKKTESFVIPGNAYINHANVIQSKISEMLSEDEFSDISKAIATLQALEVMKNKMFAKWDLREQTEQDANEILKPLSTALIETKLLRGKVQRRDTLIKRLRHFITSELVTIARDAEYKSGISMADKMDKEFNLNLRVNGFFEEESIDVLNLGDRLQESEEMNSAINEVSAEGGIIHHIYINF